ncbi:DUF2470 domain-containing protein [Nocardia miyunensis]|uniref:DUF2470 domain-containing protein n=1 Tax=Nocardia miyunensis TaxID=282684 RepID=UPI00082C681E|nr:DUF2470 domain-containing protein [Nocardia miyunensis]
MRPNPTLAPSTAERIRNACVHADHAMLALPGIDPATITVHHLRQCGDAVVAVPMDSPAVHAAARGGEGGVQAVLELTDRTPLPLREPVRALVWLRGRVRAVPAGTQRLLASSVAEDHPHPALLDVGHTTTLLRLMINSAVLADSTGAESVCHADLREARPDPFWELEAAWLQHMDADHADVVAQLARHLPTRLRGGAIHPLAIDRYGISLRVETSEEDHDVRLSFQTPVEDVQSLSRAVRILVGCPFLHGMRHM